MLLYFHWILSTAFWHNTSLLMLNPYIFCELLLIAFYSSGYTFYGCHLQASTLHCLQFYMNASLYWRKQQYNLIKTFFLQISYVYIHLSISKHQFVFSTIYLINYEVLFLLCCYCLFSLNFGCLFYIFLLFLNRSVEQFDRYPRSTEEGVSQVIHLNLCMSQDLFLCLFCQQWPWLLFFHL